MADLKSVTGYMAEQGCAGIYFKFLSENDNSKNQIYLGNNFEVLQILPFTEISHHSAGDWKRERYKAGLDFYWINPAENTKSHAPRANLILYPKYPEVRLSGFLKACRHAPSGLFQDREHTADPETLRNGRVLVLGVDKIGGKIYGYVDIRGSAVFNQLLEFREIDTIGGVLREIPPCLIGSQDFAFSTEQIIATFIEIHERGFIPSCRLTAEKGVIPYNARNGAGYTLEAQLGIIPNGVSEPDFRGWEVKQIGVRHFLKPYSSVVTLMTPEPDGGLYSIDIREFLARYGYPDMADPHRINFGGIYKKGLRSAKTRIVLQVEGCDFAISKIRNSDGGIYLLDLDGNVVASWSFGKLIKHWAKKHNRAIYVPCITRKEGQNRLYHYGNRFLIGSGTDFIRFLQSVNQRHVYLDPALKADNSAEPIRIKKKRNQFRCQTRNLGELYERFQFSE